VLHLQVIESQRKKQTPHSFFLGGGGGGGYLVERKGAEAEEINGGKKWRLGERGIYKRLYGEEGAQGWLEFWNSSEFRGTHVNEVLAILFLLFIGIIFSKKGN
jgi:hypothetical protein